MTIAFWLIIGTLIAVALYAVLPSLSQPRQTDVTDAEQVNTSIYKQKLTELKQAHIEGLLDDESYEAAQEELARALLNDTPSHQESIPHGNEANSNTKPIIIIATLIPVLSIGLYLYMGRHLAIDPSLYPRQSEDRSTLSMEAVIEQLEKQLSIGDENADTWFMLGRAYFESNQFEKAKQAFANAYKLRDDRVDIILDYAEVQARLNQNHFDDQGKQLVAQAMQLEPDSRRARWLSSVIDMQNNNSADALAIWRQLLTEGTDSPEEQQMLEMLIARHGGDDVPTPTQTESSAASIQIQVSIAPTIADQVSSTDAVFIFARAAQGPKMPLAVVKKQVGNLPITVSLSDQQAMTAAMKLSNFDKIIVGARISKTGNAIPSSGDFENLSSEIIWKEQGLVALEISDTIP